MVKKCKGGCGKPARYGKWCEIKGERYVACPVIVIKRAKAISEYRIKEAQKGKNPMQNPEICKKNHSPERNKKAAETLKKLGQLGLLPQQNESKKLKDARKKNIKKALKKLWLEDKHPRQLETLNRRKERFKKIAQTLKKLAIERKLPVQNLSSQKKKEIGKKLSIILRKKIKEGVIKPQDYGQKIPYKSHSFGKIFLRSKWERDVAILLDHLKVKWDYESLCIKYWDTERKIYANTIPDFYLPDYNLVIEVKGDGINSLQTKNKLEGLKRARYKTLLIGRAQIKLIRQNSFDDILKCYLKKQ